MSELGDLVNPMPTNVDLNTIPFGMVPPGVVPNLNDPTSLEAATMAVGLVLTIITSIVLAMSLIEHMWSLRAADYCSVVAFFFAVAVTGQVIAIRDRSVHMWDLRASLADNYWFKSVFAIRFVIIPAMVLGKLAIILFYLHVFKVSRGFRWAVYFGVVWTVCLYVPQIGVNAGMCYPNTGETWAYVSTSDRCLRSRMWDLVAGVVDLALDIYIFILPLPILIRLNLPLGKKIGLVAVFGTAILGVVASVVSMIYRIIFWESNDASWCLARGFLCEIVESYICIIVANIIPAAAGVKYIVDSSGPGTAGTRFLSYFQRPEDTGSEFDDRDIRKTMTEWTAPQRSSADTASVDNNNRELRSARSAESLVDITQMMQMSRTR